MEERPRSPHDRGGMGVPPGGREAPGRVTPTRPDRMRDIIPYVGKIIGKFCQRLLYILKLVLETSPWILLALSLLSVLEGLIPVAQAYIGAKILNILAEAFQGGMNTYDVYISRIKGLLLAQFACIIGRNIVSSVNNIVNRVAGEMVVNHVNVRIMEKANELDMESFDKPQFYEKLENASRESGNQPIRIMRSFFSIASSLIGMLTFITMIWAVNPLAPFLIIGVSVPSALVAIFFRKKNFLYLHRHSKSRRQMSYYKDWMIVNKDAAKEMRMFRLGEFMIQRYKEIFHHYFKNMKDLFYKEGAGNLVMSILNAGVNCYLFFYIAVKVAKGLLQVGDYSLYSGALNSISNGINSIITNIAVIYDATMFIDNMMVFMEEKSHIVQLPAQSREKPEIKRHIGHTIEFQHVYFRYPNQEKYVLEDVNVTLEAGESVVLVGLNGAGKTTFIKLLTRLYDPTEGVILLDGVDLREYVPDELYGIYGVIFQDFIKYAVSVEENIAFGDISAPLDKKKIHEAAVFGNADDFIDRLPKQYHTPLTRMFEEDGVDLSIGQWQKLSIARAFYADSDILILDEPTAALDAIAEQEIYNKFDELRENKTTVFVSHRLSSATTADKIIVLEYGKVIEQGNHQQLMERKGAYYQLFSMQAERYLSSAEREKERRAE